jgi:hypothetical protein
LDIAVTPSSVNASSGMCCHGSSGHGFSPNHTDFSCGQCDTTAETTTSFNPLRSTDATCLYLCASSAATRGVARRGEREGTHRRSRCTLGVLTTSARHLRHTRGITARRALQSRSAKTRSRSSSGRTSITPTRLLAGCCGLLPLVSRWCDDPGLISSISDTHSQPAAVVFLKWCLVCKRGVSNDQYTECVAMTCAYFIHFAVRVFDTSSTS